MENENSSAIIKETLYDKVFKPQKITLANGHSVLRRRSRTPLIVLLLALAIYLSLEMTGFDMGIIVSKFSKMLDLMKKILQPDWTFFPKVVSPLIDTIKMSILGTVIGCLLALPVAILSSSNINHNLPIVSVCRFILALIRTLPTLIIALVCSSDILPRNLFRHRCNSYIYLWYRSKDALREHRDYRHGSLRGHGGTGREQVPSLLVCMRAADTACLPQPQPLLL